MSLKAGFAKKEMDCFFPGLGMLGFGQAHNVVREIGTPLYSRAAAFQDEQQTTFIFINVELAFATIAVKEAVTEGLQKKLPELKLTLANIMLTSQHTHSAPGGYSHYPFYNFTVPGFQIDLFNNIVNACIEAAVEAVSNLKPSKLAIGTYEIPHEKDVAFNRSMSAYRRNPEFQKNTQVDSAGAVNRTMTGLNVYDPEGNLKAHINWFGVHATSISSYNTRIHHDNKGIAASLYEKRKNIFAIFAQEAAGDVSPNYIWDKKIHRMRGRTTDQYDNAAFNGEIQADSAEKIAATGIIDGKIDCAHAYFDLSLKAASAAHGLGFFLGTLEGPGLPHAVAPLLKVFATASKHIRLLLNKEKHEAFFKAQGKKHVLLDHRYGNILGFPYSFVKRLPVGENEATGTMFPHMKSGAAETFPWVPEILPFQIVQLGNLCIVGVPGEITTVAAERLYDTLRSKIKTEHMIISSYANAYMGYITTPEEYDQQCYEGGHCVYGRETLPAFIEYFVELAQSKNPSSATESFKFPAEELAKRTYSKQMGI
jgi:neutral ceramidase